MFGQLVQRYAADLDLAMRDIVASMPDEPDFGLMLRYAIGWVDENDQPYTPATGKRLRPTLMFLTTEAAGGNWREAIPAAAGVELLHNFSLIHDDIQDNSPTRHNRPTVWKIWGIANAINAGDAMFTMSYKALDTLSSIHPPELVLKVWQVINSTNQELTRGQHLDMRFEHQEVVSVDEYLSMIRGKSASLLAACTEIGALIATHDKEVAQHYADFGLHIGLAFQIRDDILGIWGDPKVTGKSAATDIISRKKSLPVLYGLTHSPELAKIYEKEDFGPDDVEAAINALDAVKAREYTREKELSYYDRAMKSLETAEPKGEAGDRLKEFVNFLFQRDH